MSLKKPFIKHSSTNSTNSTFKSIPEDGSCTCSSCSSILKKMSPACRALAYNFSDVKHEQVHRGDMIRIFVKSSIAMTFGVIEKIHDDLEFSGSIDDHIFVFLLLNSYNVSILKRFNTSLEYGSSVFDFRNRFENALYNTKSTKPLKKIISESFDNYFYSYVQSVFNKFLIAFQKISKMEEKLLYWSDVDEFEDFIDSIETQSTFFIDPKLIREDFLLKIRNSFTVESLYYILASANKNFCEFYSSINEDFDPVESGFVVDRRFDVDSDFLFSDLIRQEELAKQRKKEEIRRRKEKSRRKDKARKKSQVSITKKLAEEVNVVENTVRSEEVNVVENTVRTEEVIDDEVFTLDIEYSRQYRVLELKMQVFQSLKEDFLNLESIVVEVGVHSDSVKLLISTILDKKKEYLSIENDAIESFEMIKCASEDELETLNLSMSRLDEDFHSLFY